MSKSLISDRLWKALEDVNNLARNKGGLGDEPGIDLAEKANRYKAALDAVVARSSEAIQWMERRNGKL